MRAFQPTKTLIAAAVSNVPWPAWAPRPVTEQAPNAHVPAVENSGQFDSELPTVSEVQRQAKERSLTRPRSSSGPSEASKAEQTALIRVIGARMREAREELAGLSQQQAAGLLGYANSSKLAKIEGASDTNSVPLLAILRAAETYQVSIDFLFGVSDDWERDPAVCRERQVGRWLFEHLDQARTRDAQVFSEMRAMVEAVSSMIPSLADGAEQAKVAFERFIDLNPTFEDLIGGARLQASIQSLDEAGRQARLALRRLHLDMAGESAGAEAAVPGIVANANRIEKQKEQK
jgi:transcriptional regulator with XRE-family HTH domain